VVDPATIKRRRPTHQPVHLVALVQQLPSHVGAVLPGNPSNECAFYLRQDELQPYDL